MREKLSGWDVIAALVGFAITYAIVWMQAPSRGVGFVWVGGPGLVIYLRRRFLPQLSTPSAKPEIPSTPLRRVTGIALMIVAGLFLFLAAVGLYISALNRSLLGLAIGLAVFALAGWLAAVGFRRAG